MRPALACWPLGERTPQLLGRRVFRIIGLGRGVAKNSFAISGAGEDTLDSEPVIQDGECDDGALLVAHRAQHRTKFVLRRSALRKLGQPFAVGDDGVDERDGGAW